MNRLAATEWLKKAYHDLTSAKILFEADHYTDSIGVDLHYAIEKSLKTYLAYHNEKIPKTHNLPELYERVIDHIEIDDSDILYVANTYHIEMSYPQYERNLPSREEVREVLEFSEKLFYKVVKSLDIDLEEIKS